MALSAFVGYSNAERPLSGRNSPSLIWDTCAASCRAMLDYLLLLVAFVRAAVSGRVELAVENLVLRQQLAVLSRPTRKRPRLHRCDKVFWVLTRLLAGPCRYHLDGAGGRARRRVGPAA